MTEKPNRPTIHPLAFPNNRSGFNGIKAGDRIIVEHRQGWLDEVLPDGDALVTFDDGEHAIVKCRMVMKQ